MTLRVLIVTPWFPNHPADQTGNFVLHSAEALLEAGVAATILVCRPWVPEVFGYLHSDWIRPPLRADLFASELRIETASYMSIPRSRCNELFGPLFRAGARSTIRRIVRDQGSQLIHVHTESIGHAMVPVARDLGVPMVITIHGINTEPRLLDTAWKRNRLREALRYSARVVLVGEPLVTHFGPLAGSAANFRVVQNGFRIRVGDAGAKRQEWGGTIRFISVSNLHEGKGIDLNLQALADLTGAGIRDWTYSIIGDGDERPRLETMATCLGLRANVTFHGRLPHDRTLQQLANADVFLLPSYREAFGVAYLEAMASGLLAIGVSGQGPSAFIRHGETGLLVEPQDIRSLLHSIRQVFERRAEMQRIAEAGRTLVCSEFTWERHAQKLMAVYSEVLSGR